jgi:1,2-diacylglycerol 3-alpha-glucosyltransferase
MNVLIACDTYFPDINGAATFARQLAIGLTARGNRVAVLAPSSQRNERGPHLVDGITVYRVPSIAMPVPSRFRVARPELIGRFVRRAMDEFSPDVIHSQGHFFINSTAIRHARKRGLPIVGTNHIMPENIVHYMHLPPALERKAIDISWGQFKQVFRHVDVVTTPTHSAATLLKNVGFQRSVHAISNGIDVSRFHPDNCGHNVRKRFGLPEDRPVFLTVSRLDPEKRLHLVVEAFARAGEGAHLVIAGRGQERERLEAQARRLHVPVTFTGFVADDELPGLYAASDVFVIASIAELQSIVTMEAMASGLPVLAANAVALPELVKHGQTGYLFAPDDIEQLSIQMTDLATNDELRRKMGARGRATVHKHSLESVLGRFEAVYGEAIAHRGAEAAAPVTKYRSGYIGAEAE